MAMSIQIADLPHVLAGLNVTSTALILAGFFFIRRGEPTRHRACMVAAAFASVVFLAIYMIYHLNAGLARFGGEGLVRPIYFSLLIAHVFMAVVIVPLVPAMFFLAATGRFERHRKLARWALPAWLYVTVSGVVVYVMAVHLFPHAG